MHCHFGLACLGLTLAASQVDQAQLASPDGSRLQTLRQGHHLHGHAEDGVAARAVGVHERGTRGAVPPAAHHQVLAVRHARHRVLRQFYNKAIHILHLKLDHKPDFLLESSIQLLSWDF